ncbi:MAG TPA: hypothetical protein VH415_11140 [Nitrososphaeraceae archaeon]
MSKDEIKIKKKLVLVILSAVILVTPVGISTLQEQQVYAPRTCGSCGPLLEVIAQLERDVGVSVKEFAIENHPNNNIQVLYAEFKTLTGQFKTELVNALESNPSDFNKIGELHKVYTDGALRIFLGGPDTIPAQVKDDAQIFQQILQQVTQGAGGG